MTILEAAFIDMVVQASPHDADNDTLGEMDLSIYDNSDFDRGAPRWKEVVWALVRFLFFQNALPWPSSLRCSLLRAFGAKVGRNVVIRANVNISFPWRLAIGDHVWIGEDVGILTLAQVTIESNVCISQRAYLCTGSHDFRREDFKLRVAPITVREGSWIAAACFIAPGVEIGSGAVVSAGSVVFESVAPKTFVRGNPATVVSEFRGQRSEVTKTEGEGQ
jgi:putative colanic acid biosynthesis acetyltransferase WcaF